MADLNKLRQVNPHWEPSFNLKRGYGDPVKEIMAQQIDEELEEGIKEMANKHNWNGEKITLVDVEDKPEEIEKIQKELEYKEWADQANYSNKMKENRKMNPSKYTENDLEQAKCSIVEKITKQFDDTLFEWVCEEMSKNYLFQSQNYLTEAGFDIFEDEWFEFYHEHHGDILYQIRQTVFE